MKSWISNAMRAGAGFIGVLLAATAALVSGAASAFAGTGQPSDWQINFQGAASVMESIHSFHAFLLVIIFAVVLLVAPRCWSWWRCGFNEKAQQCLAHNTLIEGGVDRRAGADPGGHRHPLLPPRAGYSKADMTVKIYPATVLNT